MDCLVYDHCQYTRTHHCTLPIDFSIKTVSKRRDTHNHIMDFFTYLRTHILMYFVGDLFMSGIYPSFLEGYLMHYNEVTINVLLPEYSPGFLDNMCEIFVELIDMAINDYLEDSGSTDVSATSHCVLLHNNGGRIYTKFVTLTFTNDVTVTFHFIYSSSSRYVHRLDSMTDHDLHRCWYENVDIIHDEFKFSTLQATLLPDGKRVYRTGEIKESAYYDVNSHNFDNFSILSSNSIASSMIEIIYRGKNYGSPLSLVTLCLKRF